MRMGSWGIVTAALLAIPSIALAAEEAHDEEGLFIGDLGNAIWTLVIFVLVVVVLGKFAWGPLLSALQKREAFIHDSLASAKRDREAAEARLKEYEQRLDKAREEASGIVEEGRRDGETVRKRIEEEARKAGDEMIQRAKREINIARDTALKDLYDRSAELGIELAATVLKRQLTPEDQKRLVEDALAKLRERTGSAN